MKQVKLWARRMQERLERGFPAIRLQEWVWRYRHWYRAHWAEGYLDTLAHPHRDQIVAAVAALEPESVLEIGCASGANLARLRQRLPGVRLVGVDINRKALQVARRHFAEDRDMEFREGRADRLEKLPGVDVVLFDAVLMFIAPDRIRAVLLESLRLASKGVVLNEYHAADRTDGLFDGGRWVYDLVALIRELAPGLRVDIQPSAFHGGLWDEYGTLITVRK